MHYKQNNKESKTYVQGLRPFGNTLPRGLKGILKKNGYNYSEIIRLDLTAHSLVEWNLSIDCMERSLFVDSFEIRDPLRLIYIPHKQ